MMDSLPYRNDAAMVLRRLIRSLPTRGGVIGVATCDKGLPAMMMALAGAHDLPGVLVPGGVTLPPTRRRGRRQGPDASAPASPTATITLEEAAELGCRACASPGGGCQFLGTAATSQVVARGAGPVAAALAPWPRRGSRSGSTWPAARPAACSPFVPARMTVRDILTDAAIRNAMAVHAAFGGSTNLLLHIPAIAHAAGLRPADRRRLERRQPPRAAAGRRAAQRPVGHPTVRVFLAGGVPEVMLHLRELGLLDATVLTVDRRAARRHARLVGERRRGGGAARAAARARRRRSRRRDHAAGDGAGQRADQHRHLPPRQPRARGRGHQEHGDRPERRRTPTASIARPARPASSHGAGRHRRDQEPAADRAAGRATCWS